MEIPECPGWMTTPEATPTLRTITVYPPKQTKRPVGFAPWPEPPRKKKKKRKR